MKTLGTLKDFEIFGEKFGDLEIISTGQKYEDGSPVVVVNCEDGSRFGVLTCYVGVGDDLPENCFVVKSWSENKALADALRNGDLFEDTGLRVPTGFVEAEVWRLKNGV